MFGKKNKKNSIEKDTFRLMVMEKCEKLDIEYRRLSEQLSKSIDATDACLLPLEDGIELSKEQSSKFHNHLKRVGYFEQEREKVYYAKKQIQEFADLILSKSINSH